MFLAFNKITEQEEDFYTGKSVKLMFATDFKPFVHKGFIKEFNDNGILIKWTTIDPLGFCVGEVTYPNVRGSLDQLIIEYEGER